MATTVADRHVERLITWGVDTVFGLPGDGVNGLFEALRTHADRIQFIQVRHEEAAAFAACGYAKHSGRLGGCVAGDGGFSMLMAEMATIVKYDLPVKVVVFKNNSLGMIKWEQIVFEGNPRFGIELQPIDFAAFARACGGRGFTLEEARDAEVVFRDAFAQPGPALVEAVIDPNEPPMPGKVTTDQAMKFTEAMLRGDKDA